MKNLLSRIVTPGFIAWQAHMWFAYSVCFTWPQMNGAIVLAAATKEFYIDKHFEEAQSFDNNLQDFAGYVAGVTLAVLAHHFGF